MNERGEIDISRYDKKEVLIALYEHAKNPISEKYGKHLQRMTREEAAFFLTASDDFSFDYVNGCALKVDLSGDSFDPVIYDRDNGAGMALKAIQSLSAQTQEDTP